LRIDDTFNGELVVEFSLPIEQSTRLPLSQSESVHYEDTKLFWDKKNTAEATRHDGIQEHEAFSVQNMLL
jgi:hypothetical protein